MNLPKTEQQHAFCRAWLQHFDHNRAAREAGYSEVNLTKAGALRIFRKFEAYLLKERERKAKAVTKELVLEQRDILEEMMAIGFANAQDYVVQVSEEVEADGKKQTVVRDRQKPLMELTRRQAAAISKVTFHPDGRVTYELPDEKSKHPYLRDLGQHIGLFHPKLIQEHRHRHAMAMIDLRNMDPAKLARAEEFFLSALGTEGKRMLNIVEGEFEDLSED